MEEWVMIEHHIAYIKEILRILHEEAVKEEYYGKNCDTQEGKKLLK